MHQGHPNWKLGAYAFGSTAIGNENRKKGRNRPKDKERNCLEEIQNGQERDQILERRYPPRMIRRLRALLDVAEDSTHRDFMHAQRQVREILTRHRGTREDEDAEAAARPTDTINVTFGRIDVPMPGSPGAPIEEEGPPGESSSGGA